MSDPLPMPDIPEDALNPLPALFHHCVTIYEAMEKDAVETSNNLEQSLKVYRGHLTKLFHTNLLSTPYYSKVTSALKQMDCIRQVRRGGGGSESEWLIVQPPTRELWALVEVESNKGPAPTMQMFNDLNHRVARLEEALGLNG